MTPIQKTIRPWIKVGLIVAVLHLLLFGYGWILAVSTVGESGGVYLILVIDLPWLALLEFFGCSFEAPDDFLVVGLVGTIMYGLLSGLLAWIAYRRWAKG